MDGWTGNVAWSSSPTAFYVAGMFFDGGQYTVRRVEVGGRMKVIWSSLYRHVNRLFAERPPGGLVASFSTSDLDFWLFEPATGATP
jgi:hypothetical protein